MPLEIGQSCTWNDRVAKGAAASLAIERAEYHCCHGISPGVFVLTTIPQPDPATGLPLVPFIGAEGDLVFTDGVHGEIRIRSCRITRVDTRMGTDGQTTIITGVDRRWRWRSQTFGQGFGAVTGRYNQREGAGLGSKLVPWTIRSPAELATLCLEAMGEAGYVLALPPGLPRSAGANVERYLAAGENFPPSSTNPETVWVHTPPAEALQRLAEDLGCVVVFDPVADVVAVVPLGTGAGLPDGLPYENVSVGVKAPEVPGRIRVVGPPPRIQMKLLLEPVAKEVYSIEAGAYVPVDFASYAPRSAGRGQTSTVSPVDGQTPTSLQVQVNWTDPAGDDQVASAASSAEGLTLADRVARVRDLLTSFPAVPPAFDITSAGTTLTVKGKTAGMSFRVQAWEVDEPSGASAVWAAAVTRVGVTPGNSWESSAPGNFHDVRPPEVVPYAHARAAAVSSVWLAYRPLLVNPLTGAGDLIVPTFGKVKRLQQIQISDRMVEQIVPQPRVAGGINRGSLIGGPAGPAANIPGQGVLPPFYDGLARERPAVVRGSVAKVCFKTGDTIWLGPDLNTAEKDIVPVPFTVVPERQLVMFSSYVYKYDFGATSYGGGYGFIRKPRLVLETGVTLLDENTNLPNPWSKAIELTGGATEEVHYHEDLAVGIVVGPETPGEPGVSTVSWGGDPAASTPVDLTIAVTRGGTTRTATVRTSGTTIPIAERWSRAAGATLADDTGAVIGDVTLTVQGATLTVTGTENFRLTVAADNADYTVVRVRAGREDVVGAGYKYAEGSFEYANQAADYYLNAHARRYRLSAAESRQYVGLHPVRPTGVVRMVSWSVGAGATTTASANTEHSQVIPPAPERQFRENLPPNKSARLANLAERTIIDSLPKPGVRVK